MKKIIAICLMSLILVGCKKVSVEKLKPSDTIVAFGDSLTFGFGAQEKESYPMILESLIGIKVVNEGVSGNTTVDGLNRIDTVLEQNPKIVLLSLGGNDMLRHFPESQTIQNLKIIIGKIKNKGAIPMLISEPKPSILGVSLGLSDADLFKKIAKEEKIMVIEKTFSKYLSKDEFKSDLIHLNAKGYALVAKDIKEELESAGFL